MSDLSTTLNLNPDADRPPAAGALSSTGLRFQVLRPLARGGLGEVLVALDGELHREVALKEIRAQHAHDPESRARFLLEAEVTGSLEHPGVVPVYGLGHYPDGRPFYAMRLIRGHSLLTAIEQFHLGESPRRDSGERALALRGLLGRFVGVCNAVAYAHSRGVLHRDLKPANVMLGPFGETLVVDWGLAKPTGRAQAADSSGEGALRPAGEADDSLTQGGAVLGTPAFMAPEQAAGQLDRVGPASDVYSLGATLYCLLTGQAPYGSGERGSVVDQVRQGSFPPPRRVKPEVPAPLEAVCLKAMAREPGDRYDSARALADDVEHWLAEEPVSAYREPAPARLGRWARRHKPLVSGAAALLVTAVLALAVGLVVLDREQRRTEVQRRAAVAAEERARENARAAAEQRGLALDTLKNVVFHVQDELRKRPGMMDLQRTLLTRAEADLRRVARSTESSAEAGHDTVWVYFQLGELFRLLGKMDDSRRHFGEALRRAREFAEADPESELARRDLVAAHTYFAEVVGQTGDAARALDLYLQALRLLRASADPADVRTGRDFSTLYLKLGWATLRAGDVTGADNYYRQAVDTLERLRAADPDNRRVPKDLGAAYTQRADVCLQRGDTTTALELYRKDLELSEALARADPRDVQAQRDLAVACNKLGAARLRTDDTGSARALFDRALGIRQGLARADPRNAQAQRDLSTSYETLGDLSLRSGDVRAARLLYQKDLEISEKLAGDDPLNVEAQRDLAVSYFKLGQVCQRLGEAKGAREFFGKDLEISRALADADPGNAQGQGDLALSCLKLGDLCRLAGDFAAARDYYGQSRTLREKLARSDPHDVEAQAGLAGTYGRLGGLEQEATDIRRAIEWYERALALLRPLEGQGKLKDLADETRLIRNLESSLAVCRAAPRAVEDLDFALGQPAALVPELLSLRNQLLAARGRHAEAAATAARLVELGPQKPEYLYRAACAFALCVPAAGAGKGPGQLSPEEKADRERYAARAVALLNEALRNGFGDLAGLKMNVDFASLRDRADFRKVLGEIETRLTTPHK